MDDTNDSFIEDLAEDISENSEIITDVAFKMSSGEPETTVLTLAAAFAKACVFHGVPSDEYFSVIKEIEEKTIEEINETKNQIN